jgi:hypothetical protein
MSKTHKKKKSQNGQNARPQGVAGPGRSGKATETKAKAAVVRIRLVNGLHVCLTGLIILAVVAVMLVMEWMGWFDTIPGAVLSVLMGGLAVMCFFDMAMLLTNCITVSEGMVNAGKNDQGDLMIFHTGSVERVELRDKTGRVVPEDRKKYRRVSVTFVMSGGRINQRPLDPITQAKLNRLRELMR